MKSLRYSLSVLLLGSIGFLGCEHENAPARINISGISMFDQLGAPMSAPDPDDWKKDAYWTPEETKVLLYDGMTEFKDAAPSDSNQVTIWPAYPNPSKGQVSMQIKASKNCKLKVALVDEYLNKVLETELNVPAAGKINFAFEASAIKKGKLYRLYYVVLNDKNEVYLKGHGDISYVEQLGRGSWQQGKVFSDECLVLRLGMAHKSFNLDDV